MSDGLQTRRKTVFEYQDFILSWILKTTSAKTIALIDVELVVSETLRNLLSDLDKKENKSIDENAIRRKCRTIAKRNVLDAKKEAKRERRGGGRNITSIEAGSVAEQSDSSNPVAAFEQADFILKVESMFDGQHVRVAKLKREGNSYREIAKELGVCVGTVQTIVKEIETTVRLLLN